MKRNSLSRNLCLMGMLIFLIMGVLGGCGKPELEKIEITPATTDLTVGESVTFSAKGMSAKNEDVPELTFSWSAKGDGGAIDANGVFTASLPGTAVVTVTSGAISAETTLTIHPLPVAELQVTADKQKALAKTAISLKIAALTSDGKPAGYNEITVSSPTKGIVLSSEQIKLDPEGKADMTVTLGPDAGPNEIALKAGDVTKQLTIEGFIPYLERIEIAPQTAALSVTGSATFTAVGYSNIGEKMDSVDFSWAVDSDAGSVDDNGVFTATAPGTAKITVSSGKVNAAATIEVSKLDVAKIVITPEKKNVQAGTSTTISIQALAAEDKPAGFNEITLSSPTGGAVLAKETVMLGPDGKTDIAVTLSPAPGLNAVVVNAGDVSDTVQINGTAITHLTIQPDAESFMVGKTITFEALGHDDFDNSRPVKAQWSLTGETAGLGDNGQVTLLNLGEAVIQADYKEMQAEHAFTVVPAELAKIVVDPAELNVHAGDTVTLTASGFDRFDNPVTVTPQFSIAEDLGQLSETGKFIAQKTGTTSIMVQSEGIEAQCPVTIAAAELDRLIIEPKGPIAIKAGETLQFTLHAFDAFENAVRADIQWTLTPDLGAIDAQGLLTPKTPGEGQIAISVKDLDFENMLDADIALTVKPGDPAKVVITPAKTDVVAGEKMQFEAQVFDICDNLLDKKPTWRIGDFPMGDIDANGLFDAFKAGAGKVLASVGDVTGEADVLVIPGQITYLKVTPSKIATTAGKAIPLITIGEDNFGNVVDTEIVWDLSDKSLGGVSAENVFIPGKQGKGNMLAIVHDIIQKIPVEVEIGPLATIKIMPDSAQLPSGEDVQFSATGCDAGGNPVEIEPTWSIAQPEIGAIDENGVFLAVKTGMVTVSAAADNIQASAQYEINPGAPSKIELLPESVEITAGDSIQLHVKVFDGADNLIAEPSYKFEVDGSLGNVNADNLFKAHGAGAGNINIYAGNASAKIPVTVNAGEVAKIDVLPNAMDVVAGAQQQFEAKAYDSEGNPLELDIKWSVVMGIGSIDQTGLFNAVTAGPGLVVCQMNNISGVSQLTILPGPVDHITIEPAQITLTAGDLGAFTATAFDANDNVTSAEFEWQLDAPEYLGGFEAPGQFAAKKVGTGQIIAIAGEQIKGSSELTVAPATAEKLEITQVEASLESGKEIAFEAIATDAFENRFPVTPAWTIDPPELGEMTESGAFLAKKAGDGTVAASIDGLESKVSLTVAPGKLVGVQIQPVDTVLESGKTYTFAAVGHDVNGNVVPAEIEWAVTANIGTIDKTTGELYTTAVGAGAIAAYHGELAAYLPIEVSLGDLKYIFISPNPITVASNETQEFTISGMDAEKNMVDQIAAEDWQVDGNIGVFESPGVFRGTHKGIGKVTVAVNDLRAEAYVTVVPGTPDLNKSRLRLSHVQITAAETETAEILVDIRDANGNPVPDVAVRIASSRAQDTIVQPEKTDASGKSVGSISSSEPGQSQITAYIDDIPVRDTAELTFK